MPYEIVFNQKPNIGMCKKIVELCVNDKNEEIEIEITNEEDSATEQQIAS